jgi:hypothetical protein
MSRAVTTESLAAPCQGPARIPPHGATEPASQGHASLLGESQNPLARPGLALPPSVNLNTCVYRAI